MDKIDQHAHMGNDVDGNKDAFGQSSMRGDSTPKRTNRIAVRLIAVIALAVALKLVYSWILSGTTPKIIGSMPTEYQNAHTRTNIALAFAMFGIFLAGASLILRSL